MLATSPVGRAPARHRGRDTVEWLVQCCFFDQPPGDQPDTSALTAPQPLIVSGGRSVSLQTLARAGVTLTGPLAAVDGEQVRFDESVLANIAAGDAFADRIRAMLDEFISRGGQQVPPAESDPADVPLDPDDFAAPAELDLNAAAVGSVIWCTGYTGDFSWLPPAMIDGKGRPRHDAGAARCQGSGTSACAGSPTEPPQLPRLPHRRRHNRRRRGHLSGEARRTSVDRVGERGAPAEQGSHLCRRERTPARAPGLS